MNRNLFIEYSLHVEYILSIGKGEVIPSRYAYNQAYNQFWHKDYL